MIITGCKTIVDSLKTVNVIIPEIEIPEVELPDITIPENIKIDSALGNQINEKIIIAVITSYSIHYTKLYENL